MDKSEKACVGSFSIHVISMNKIKHDVEIRVLWVSDAGDQAVYEGISCWSLCRQWMSHLSCICDNDYDHKSVVKHFEKCKVAAIRNVKTSPTYIESLGFTRADEL